MHLLRLRTGLSGNNLNTRVGERGRDRCMHAREKEGQIEGIEREGGERE